jgi:hypothetical protein
MREIDSTEEEIPENVTKEELLKDQNREISEKEKEDSEMYLEESGLENNKE